MTMMPVVMVMSYLARELQLCDAVWQLLSVSCSGWRWQWRGLRRRRLTSTSVAHCLLVIITDVIAHVRWVTKRHFHVSVVHIVWLVRQVLPTRFFLPAPSSTTQRNYAAFTPNTCSPDTSCIHLYPFVTPVAVYMYPVSATKLSLRRIVSTCMYVSGYKLLVRDTCIRLHVSAVNAALVILALSTNDPLAYNVQDVSKSY